VVKPALYLIAGVTEQLTGATDIRRFRGLINAFPGLTLVFFVGALSLVGIPPLSGFFGKFAAVQGGFLAGRYGIAAVALGVSLLILYSLVLIFKECFWGETELDQTRQRISAAEYRRLLLPAATLIAISVAMGLGAEYVAQF